MKHPLRLAFILLAVASPLLADSTPFASAKSLYDQSKNTAATAAFTALLPGDRANPEIHYHLGLLALRRDDPKAALSFFESAIKLAPDHSEYHRRLGDALAVLAQRVNVLSAYGLARKSKRAYETAVDLDPANIGSRWALLEYCKNAPAVVGGSMTEAYAQADAIEKLDAANGRWARAIVLLHDKKSADALALYASALTATPSNYVELVRFGFLAQWSGTRLDEGLHALDTCLTLEPPAGEAGHARIHLSRGQIFEKLQQPAAARTAYEAALAQSPGFTPAIDALAKLP